MYGLWHYLVDHGQHILSFSVLVQRDELTTVAPVQPIPPHWPHCAACDGVAVAADELVWEMVLVVGVPVT